MSETAVSICAERTINKVAILGVGLIGGSIGAALRHSQYPLEVVGWDKELDTLDLAAEVGCIDHPNASLLDAVRDADLIIISTPVSATVSILELIANEIGRDVAVTDVGSTKQRICSHADIILRGQFVGDIQWQDQKSEEYPHLVPTCLTVQIGS